MINVTYLYFLRFCRCQAHLLFRFAELFLEKRRLLMFQDDGKNCMSTYIPQRFGLLSYDSGTRVPYAFKIKCNDFFRPASIFGRYDNCLMTSREVLLMQ